MVNPYRIKSYLFPVAVSSNAGSIITQYTDFIINGDLLRFDVCSNFTGSVILKQSGLTIAWLNATVTSGTSKWETFPFINTTGSFVTNSIVQFMVSGLMSGTTKFAGPAEILYR
jgi:hypothetical protein